MLTFFVFGVWFYWELILPSNNHFFYEEGLYNSFKCVRSVGLKSLPVR